MTWKNCNYLYALKENNNVKKVVRYVLVIPKIVLERYLKKHDHEMSYMVGSKNEVPSLGVGSKI
jgi:hypothetical protein